MGWNVKLTDDQMDIAAKQMKATDDRAIPPLLPHESSCVACIHFTLRDVGAMAREGCGRCVHDAAYTTYPAMREWECSKFKAAEAELVEKRKEWLGARN